MFASWLHGWMLAAVLLAPTYAEPLKKRTYADYGYQQVNGVNLGGWGVLEPWITPSIFESVDQSLGIVDEYTLCQQLGAAEATSILQQHWSTWYTFEDFQNIAATGINTLRIPVGYWSFFLAPGDPYVQGFEPYLDEAIGWAQEVGLSVWIDLHGAPGSQNGFDNSGRRGAIDWPYGQNVNYTLQALSIIVNKYSQTPFAGTVVGIEVLNEPLGTVISTSLIQEYYAAATNLIKAANSEMSFIVHDAFLSLNSWDYLAQPADNPNAVLDTHHYEVFTGDYTFANQMGDVCGFGSNIANNNPSIYTVVGEWSGAQTDCATWLNGYGIGARYDGTYDGFPYVGSCAATNENSEISTWTETQKVNTRKFIEAQLDAWSEGAGWIFWCAKTESASYWDFLRLVDGGIFPQPFDAREYPDQCYYY